ncbi:hypothetical protein AtNW77_Chr1g0039041 [Arabidopsis thaliana]
MMLRRNNWSFSRADSSYYANRRCNFLEMLTSMEETLKRVVCALERIESRSISDDGRQLDLPIFTKVLMELDLEMKQWIKDFDRKRDPHKLLE